MGVLSDTQAMMVAILESDSALAPVKILSENLGDINSQIRMALGKIGICAIVLTPDASVDGTNAPGPLLKPVGVVVEIEELVVVNRGDKGSKLPASDVAERVLWRGHSPNWPTRGDTRLLTGKGIKLIPDKQFLIYRVEFETTGALAYET